MDVWIDELLMDWLQSGSGVMADVAQGRINEAEAAIDVAERAAVEQGSPAGIEV